MRKWSQRCKRKNQKQLWRIAAPICLAPLCLALGACSSSPGSGGGPGTLSLSLSSSMALAPQDGTPAKITANATGNSGAVTFAVSGVPTGTASNVAQQSGGTTAAIALNSSASTPAGTYTVKVTATDSVSSVSQNLTLVVAVAGIVSSTVDQTQGVKGKLVKHFSRELLFPEVAIFGIQHSLDSLVS